MCGLKDQINHLGMKDFKIQKYSYLLYKVNISTVESVGYSIKLIKETFL